ARHHQVVDDHPQAAKDHPLRIVIIREAEGVISIQPPVVRVAPFMCFSYHHHGGKMPHRQAEQERPCFLPEHTFGLCSLTTWNCAISVTLLPWPRRKTSRARR